VVADFALRHLLNQEALGTIDDLTRLYVLWRWSYGTQPVPADRAYKLAQVFGVDLDSLRSRSSLVDKQGDNVTLHGPTSRGLEGKGAAGAEPLITTIHRAMLLWTRGATTELSQLLSRTGLLDEPALWAIVQVLAEVAPDGSDERMLAEGLGGGRGRIKQAAPASPVEQKSLWEAT
jgi:hypothetical protein